MKFNPKIGRDLIGSIMVFVANVTNLHASEVKHNSFKNSTSTKSQIKEI